MVAYVSGNGLGLFNSSLDLLGSSGAVGDAATGRANERAYVNAATGNLVLRQDDEFLKATGIDASLVRTYNSLGQFNDDNGDNWRLGFSRRLSKLTGTINTAGSTITRTDEDGADTCYTYDGTTGCYVSDAGDGARDTLTVDIASSQWTWHDGDSQTTELYSTLASGGQLLSIKDRNGNTLALSYTGNLVTSIQTSSGERIDFIYDTAAGKTANLNQINTWTKANATDSAPSVMTTSVRYTYDSLNRLTSVIVDLTPQNNGISDGKIYQTAYTYDGTSRRIASLFQTDGSQLRFTYDASNRIKTVTGYRSSTDQRVTTLDYSVPDQTTLTDPLGQATTMG